MAANLSNSSLLLDSSSCCRKNGTTFRCEDRNASRLVLQRAIGPVRSDRAFTEGLLEHVQHFGSVGILAHRKTRSDLPTESVTAAAVEGHTEATFAIRVAGHVCRFVRGSSLLDL